MDGYHSSSWDAMEIRDYYRLSLDRRRATSPAFWPVQADRGVVKNLAQNY